MGNCKDCKHWGSHLDTRNKRWTTCEAPDDVERGGPRLRTTALQSTPKLTTTLVSLLG